MTLINHHKIWHLNFDFLIRRNAVATPFRLRAALPAVARDDFSASLIAFLRGQYDVFFALL